LAGSDARDRAHELDQHLPRFVPPADAPAAGAVQVFGLAQECAHDLERVRFGGRALGQAQECLAPPARRRAGCNWPHPNDHARGTVHTLARQDVTHPHTTTSAEEYKTAPRSDTVRLLSTVRANSFGAAYLPLDIV
jgi:hypothetical protein